MLILFVMFYVLITENKITANFGSIKNFLNLFFIFFVGMIFVY